MYRVRVATTTSAGTSGAGGPVPYELLVEGELRPAGLPRVGRPEPRGVRRQQLVAEHEGAVAGPTELQLGVRDDDAPCGSDRRAPPVDVQGGAPELLGRLRADHLRHVVEGDELVVRAGRRLRGRREDRFRQLRPFDEAGR